MATWQKCIVILGAVVFAFVGFAGTKEYGPFWQIVGAMIGGLTGAIGGFLVVAHISGDSSESD
jgi:hypothetical protein